MSNTDHAAEPTMEEILSSIRKIISDDDKGPKTVAAKPAPKPRPAAPAVQRDPEPAPVPPPEPEPIDQGAADDIFELTDVVDEQSDDDNLMDAWRETTEEVPADAIPDVKFVEPQREAEAMPVPEPVAPPTAAAAPAASQSLLSDDATNAASAAFGQLANTLLSRQADARTLEELVQEMLRPMLQAWLNENLPPLVERLVREEIERVARRR